MLYDSTIGAFVIFLQSLAQVPRQVVVVYMAFNGLVLFLASSC